MVGFCSKKNMVNSGPLLRRYTACFCFCFFVCVSRLQNCFKWKPAWCATTLKKTSRGKKLCICIFIKTILGLEKVHDIHTYIFLLRSNRTPKREIFIALSPDYPGIALVILKKLLLMAEILHHLGCCKWWDKLPINWCRISSINSGDPNHSEWKIELHHCRSQIL